MKMARDAAILAASFSRRMQIGISDKPPRDSTGHGDPVG